MAIQIERQVGFVTVRAQGPLADRGVPDLRTRLDTVGHEIEAGREDISHVVVDLTTATTVSRLAFAVLASFIHWMRMCGRDSIVLAPAEDAIRCIKDSGLEGIIKIAPTESVAFERMVKSAPREYSREFLAFLIQSNYMTRDQLATILAQREARERGASIEVPLMASRIVSWKTMFIALYLFRRRQARSTTGTLLEETAISPAIGSISTHSPAAVPPAAAQPVAVQPAASRLVSAQSAAPQPSAQAGDRAPVTSLMRGSPGGATATAPAPTVVLPASSGAATLHEEPAAGVAPARGPDPFGTSPGRVRALDPLATSPGQVRHPNPLATSPGQVRAPGPSSEFVTRSLMGELLVEVGLITSEQLRKALEEQRRAGEDARLGDVLTRMGFVTDEQIFSVLEKQYERRGAKGPRPDGTSPGAVYPAKLTQGGSEFIKKSLLGEILLELGLVNADALRRALEEQRRAATPEKLGAILLRLGIVTRDQIFVALETQARRKSRR